MADRRAQIVILSEDRQSEVFFVRFMRSIGVENHKIRKNTGPPGLGSGAQYVRDNYSKELFAYRKRGSYLALKLIIVTDADNLTVEGRRRQLSASLTSAEMHDPTPDEAVAVLIPKRNIETWIAYLSGRKVDEATEYRHLDRAGDCQPAVDKLVDWYRSNWTLPDDCPDSLRWGVEELKRIV